MIRIIAGLWRRRLIQAPDPLITRPTSNRLRETMFNILTAHLLKNDCSFQGMQVADVFAGSGALGLEALSRGAQHATFVEKNHHASSIIETNIQALGACAQSTVMRADVLTLKAPSSPYDLVFLDPPYQQGLIAHMLERLQESHWLHAQSLVVIEAKITDQLVISCPWQIKDHRTSGIAALWLISLKEM